MSEVKNKKFIIKLFIIFSFALVNIGCAYIRETTVNTYDGKSSYPITSTSRYEVAFNGNTISFSTFKEAQDYAKQSTAFIFNLPQSIESRYQTLTNLSSNTNVTTETQTTGQADIISSGHSTTGNPNQNFSLSDNFTLNGMDPSTKTGLAAAVAIGVIGGITAGVVTAVNDEASKKAEDQKKNDWTTLLLLSQQKSGGSNCIPNPQNPC